MQFDTALNTGLYVTNDINAASSDGGPTVAQRLPKTAVSVEAWFTAEEEKISTAGLVGVLQDAPGCALGWSLTFDRKKAVPVTDKGERYVSTYVFKVALQKPGRSNESTATVAPPSFVELRHSASLDLFVWTHVIAVYNSSHLLLFVNGLEAAVQEACDDHPCGDIVYSYSQHVQPHTCVPGETALTIGTVHGTLQEVLKGYKFPHQGLLKHVRILSAAVSAPGAALLHGIYAPQMKLVAPSKFEYWVKASSLPGPHRSSPSIDAVHAETQDWVTSRGNFSTEQQYRCKFTSGDHTLWSPANTSCSSDHTGMGECYGQFADQLTCQTPRWRVGFRAATFSIVKKQERLPLMSFEAFYANLVSTDRYRACNDTWCGSMCAAGCVAVNDTRCMYRCFLRSQNSSDTATTGWRSLWQRVCVRKDCGFLPSLERTQGRGTPSWYTAGDRNLLSPALGGGITRIRMLTPGAIYKVSKGDQRLTQVSTFMTGRFDAWGTLLRNRYAAAGVSQYTHTTVRDEHYLIGATAWDGSSPNSTSSLYHFNESSGHLKLIQEIDTFGARRWLFFSVDDTLLAAVANHNGPSAIYKCSVRPRDASDPSSTEMLSLQTADALRLPILAASSVTAFAVEDAQYLLFSTLYDSMVPEQSSLSVLYRVRKEIDGSVTATVIQELSVAHASDVTHFTHAGFIHIIFAVNHATSPSELFSANISQLSSAAETPTSRTGRMEIFGQHAPYAATLATKRATSVRIFEYIDEIWLTVTVETDTPITSLFDDAQVSPKTMRFNGTHFIGKTKSGTSARDSAGGQLLNITVDNVELVHVRTGESAVLLAGNFRNGDDGVDALQVLPASVTTVEGLLRPTSIAISPVDGKFVYVASAGSQNIVVFARDDDGGLLAQTSIISRPPDAPASALGGMPSFRSIQSIAISPDQRHLYATLMAQDEIAVLNISASSGALNMLSHASIQYLSVATDQKWLHGAYGIHVSAGGTNVYVSAYFDGALVAFARNASDGSLSYLDAVRDGQRLFEDYEDLPLPMTSSPNAEPAGSSPQPTYPSTLQFRNLSAPPRKIRHFTIEGKSLMAVTSSSLRWDLADGALTIFEWQGEGTGHPTSTSVAGQVCFKLYSCICTY